MKTKITIDGVEYENLSASQPSGWLILKPVETQKSEMDKWLEESYPSKHYNNCSDMYADRQAAKQGCCKLLDVAKRNYWNGIGDPMVRISDLESWVGKSKERGE